MLEENSGLPNLDSEGRFRRIAEMRHKCGVAAIETGANAKIRKSLIGRSRPMQGNYVPGDLVYHWRAGNGVHQAQGGNVWYLIVRQLSCVQSNSCAEREMREMLMRRIGGDDPDERSKHGVPKQQDLTQQQPPTQSPPQKQRLHHSLRRNHKNSNYERIQDNSNFIQNQDHR